MPWTDTDTTACTANIFLSSALYLPGLSPKLFTTNELLLEAHSEFVQCYHLSST